MQEEESYEETEQDGLEEKSKNEGLLVAPGREFPQARVPLVGQMHRSRGGEGIP